MTAHGHRTSIDALDRSALAVRSGRTCVVFLLGFLLGGRAVLGQDIPVAASNDNAVAPQPATDNTNTNEAVPGTVVAEGQITDGIGSGQADVAVSLRRKGAGGEEGELIGATTTNPQGDFAIRAAAPLVGEFVIRFDKPLHASIVHTFRLNPGDATPFFDDQMLGNLALIGRVEDALTKQPIAHAAVNLKAMFSDRSAETNEKGEFTIKGVSPGRGKLTVVFKGYGREVVRIERLEEFGEVVVKLKPERLLHVTVLDDQRQPIRGVTAEVYDDDREDFRSFITDESGKFDVPGVHFDARSIGVRLTHVEHVSSMGFDQTIEPPADVTESAHVLTMLRAGRVTGRLTNAASGKALNGARVMSGGVQTESAPTDFTDPDGRFTLTGVAPGNAVITIHRDGYAPELRRVDVVAGETARLDVAMLAGLTLKGIVKLDPDGKPIGDAMIDATRWRNYSTLGLRAVSLPDGTFEIENAPVDEFEVTVSARGAVRSTVTLKAEPGKTSEITLAPSAAVAGDGELAAVKVGDSAPVITVTLLDGKSINLTEYKGKVVLLDFWATWCGPCVGEIPNLVAAFEKFGQRKDFVMLSVSLDQDEGALREFVKRRRMNWMQAVGPSAMQAADQYGVQGIPALFVIGPDGRVIATDFRGEQIGKRIGGILDSSAATE